MALQEHKSPVFQHDNKLHTAKYRILGQFRPWKSTRGMMEVLQWYDAHSKRMESSWRLYLRLDLRTCSRPESMEREPSPSRTSHKATTFHLDMRIHEYNPYMFTLRLSHRCTAICQTKPSRLWCLVMCLRPGCSTQGIFKCWCRSSSKWDQVQHGKHLAPFLLLSTALITQHNGDEICL